MINALVPARKFIAADAVDAHTLGFANPLNLRYPMLPGSTSTFTKPQLFASACACCCAMAAGDGGPPGCAGAGGSGETEYETDMCLSWAISRSSSCSRVANPTPLV